MADTTESIGGNGMETRSSRGVILPAGAYEVNRQPGTSSQSADASSDWAWSRPQTTAELSALLERLEIFVQQWRNTAIASAIRFDDPIRVYAATGIINWLGLRWLGILQLLIPTTVIAGSLWAAGNVPSTFQDLSVAILSGYSADSLFRMSVERVRSSSEAAATQGTAD